MPGFFILLPPHLRPGSLVNRASDSGSEGRGFESHPGHYKRGDTLNSIPSFLYSMLICHFYHFQWKY